MPQPTLIDQTEKPTPKRSAHPQHNCISFSQLTSGLREFQPQIYSLRKWEGPIMPNGQLGQGTLGCRSLSSLPFGCFSSPTNIPTHPSNI